MEAIGKIEAVLRCTSGTMVNVQVVLHILNLDIRLLCILKITQYGLDLHFFSN